jgi:Lar family restriction alleviation protein
MARLGELTMAKEEKQAEELEPCPFCGNEDLLIETENPSIGRVHYFVSCSCGIMHDKCFKSQAEAITAWNTRTDTERDELRAAIEEFIEAHKMSGVTVWNENVVYAIAGLTKALDKAKK